MSPDEIATLLDWIANEIDARLYDPGTHVPMSGEQAVRILSKILRQAGERAATA